MSTPKKKKRDNGDEGLAEALLREPDEGDDWVEYDKDGKLVRDTTMPEKPAQPVPRAKAR